MQLNKNVSLDQIICDPDLANEFDRYASSLSPGYQPLDYRWAALGLRKAGRLNKKQHEIKELPNLEKLGLVNSVKIEDLPLCGGIYMFSSNSEKIFTSQTDNLRHRYEKHLEVSNSRGLPYWLWEIKREPLIVEVAALPNESRNTRQAIEKQIIKTFKPLLNIERKVA